MSSLTWTEHIITYRACDKFDSCFSKYNANGDGTRAYPIYNMDKTYNLNVLDAVNLNGWRHVHMYDFATKQHDHRQHALESVSTLKKRLPIMPIILSY